MKNFHYRQAYLYFIYKVISIEAPKSNFQGIPLLPGLPIVAPMLFDKVLLATLKFSIYGVHILNKLVFIVSKTCIKEPKRSISQRELLYNLCAQSKL